MPERFWSFTDVMGSSLMVVNVNAEESFLEACVACGCAEAPIAIARSAISVRVKFFFICVSSLFQIRQSQRYEITHDYVVSKWHVLPFGTYLLLQNCET